MHDRIAFNIRSFGESKEIMVIFQYYNESIHLTMTEDSAKYFAESILETVAENQKKRHEDLEKIRSIDFLAIERELEKRYVKVPYIPSPATLYGEGHRDGYIDDETYRLAAIYYGRMWNYCGD